MLSTSSLSSKSSQRFLRISAIHHNMTHFISESTVHEYQYSIEHFPETSSLMTSGYGTNYDFSICSRSPHSSLSLKELQTLFPDEPLKGWNVMRSPSFHTQLQLEMGSRVVISKEDHTRCSGKGHKLPVGTQMVLGHRCFPTHPQLQQMTYPMERGRDLYQTKLIKESPTCCGGGSGLALCGICVNLKAALQCSSEASHCQHRIVQISLSFH